jgi:uncharacterized protein
MSGASRVVEGKALTREVVEFRGHPMVRSSHPTTIEITTEEYLTENGDCIIGVGAHKGCAGLSSAVKERLRIEGSRVTLKVAVDGLSFVIRAQGDPRLTLTDPHEMVVRKSDYVSGRTLAVRADASSRDVPREIVRLLKNPATTGTLEIEVD